MPTAISTSLRKRHSPAAYLPLKIENGSGPVPVAGQDALQIVGFQPFLTLADSNSGFPRARIQNANGDINFFTEASLGGGIPPLKIENSFSAPVQIAGQDALQIVGFQPFLTLADSNSGFPRARIRERQRRYQLLYRGIARDRYTADEDQRHRQCRGFERCCPHGCRLCRRV